MGDLFLALVGLIERGGRPAAMLAILVGLALAPVGWWLAFEMPGTAPADAHLIAHAQEGDGLAWPIMLLVSILGVCLAGLGLAALVSGRWRSVALAAAQPGPASVGADGPAVLDAMALPFWVCGDCACIEAGVSITERCMSCGSATSFVAVGQESERAMARSVMGYRQPPAG